MRTSEESWEEECGEEGISNHLLLQNAGEPGEIGEPGETGEPGELVHMITWPGNNLPITQKLLLVFLNDQMR